MPVTGISNRGLAAITFLVLVLWGCIFAERLIVRHARHQADELIRTRGPAPVRFLTPEPARDILRTA